MHNNKYTHSSFRYFPCVRNHINASVNLGIWCALTKYIVWNLRVIYIGTVVAGMCACVEIYFLCYIVNTSVCIAPFAIFVQCFIFIYLFVSVRRWYLAAFGHFLDFQLEFLLLYSCMIFFLYFGVHLLDILLNREYIYDQHFSRFCNNQPC